MMGVGLAPFLVIAGSAVVVYALVGYSLLLLIWGRLAPKPIRRAPIEPTVSVLIPVRNGERWISAKLESVFALRYSRSKLQVIVISDGSTDGTAAIAAQFPEVEFLALPPGGKCLALNAGMARATGEILFFTDVRQPLHPECLANLVSNFADPTVGVVSGELVITSGDRQEHAHAGLYMRHEEWLRKQISKVGSVPGATGACYAMRRRLAVPLPADILLDDVYQPVSAYLQGSRVLLDGSAIAYDYPVNLGSEFRRKVRTLAGIYQIAYRFPALLDPRQSIWIHFLSHKLTRLMLPYAFLLILVASFFLPDPWRGPLLGAQALFYGLALLDFLLPEGFPLKRFSSLVRTFLTLLVASAAAGSIMFRSSRELWSERR